MQQNMKLLLPLKPGKIQETEITKKQCELY